LPFSETDKTNRLYSAVRELFIRLGLDSSRVGTPEWNPFREFVRPGEKVVIKPNLVYHEKGYLAGSNCVVTHSSVLRPLVDYTLLALDGSGEVAICDAPLQSADLDAIMASSNLQSLLRYYESKNLPVRFYDLRLERVVANDSYFFEDKIAQRGDPQGYAVIDLGAESELEGISNSPAVRFAVSDYSEEITQSNHRKHDHKYLISKTILESDVFINVPKLKSHQKAGLTVCLKNLVGINGAKAYLPHFRIGSPRSGGDEYGLEHRILHYLHSYARRSFQGKNKLLYNVSKGTWKFAKRMLGMRTKLTPLDGGNEKKFFMCDGSWYGNDTLWRTIVDLNKILFLCNKSGEVTDSVQRRYFALVDGVVAGEGNGPIEPFPKKAGILLAGFNPVLIDTASALLMGFDATKIPLLIGSRDFERRVFKSDTTANEKSVVQLMINEGWQTVELGNLPSFDFLPPPAWVGCIERRGIERNVYVP